MGEESWIFIGGIGASILAYLSKHFVFVPLREFNRLRGRVHGQLKYYANAFANSVDAELQKEATNAIRRLSCDLDEAYFAIGLRKLLSWLRLVPSFDAVEDASRNLIGLSNSTGINPDSRMADKVWEQPDLIREKLNIPHKTDSPTPISATPAISRFRKWIEKQVYLI